MLLLFAVIFAADQWLKWWTQANIPPIYLSPNRYPYGGIGVFEDLFGVNFSLVYTLNRGAAWGLFSEFPGLLLAFRSVFISALGVFLFLGRIPSQYRLGALLLFAGGASNIFDVFVYGSVVDMFKFDLWGYEYPVFNIADSAIFIGIALTLIKNYAQRD